MSQALYRKYRPARFTDVVGQEHVTQTLRNAIAGERVGHAYLFCGPRGTGKTTSARLVAKAVNCKHDEAGERPDDQCSICLAINEGRFLDLIEIDAASNTGVDDIRDLRDKINFAPSEGRFKVYIIDEVHMLSTAAFNALLKTLEEPPPHAMFVLATTEAHKVPLTIKSRCQQFNFRLLTTDEIIGRLQWLAEQESLTIEPAALELIAREGNGSLRDAESLLDQLVTAPGDTITLDRTQKVLGTAASASIQAIADAWLNNDAAAGLATIHAALAAGADSRQLCRQMVIYLRQLLLLHTSGSADLLSLPADQVDVMQAQAKQADRRGLIRIVRLFNEPAVNPGTSWQPQLPLELAFVESVTAETMIAAPVAPATPKAKKAVAPKPVLAKSAAAAVAAPKPATTEKPKPVAASKAAEPTPVAEGALTLPIVTQHWPDLMSAIRGRDRNLPALLAACKPLAVQNNTIFLGFDYPILKDKFEGHAEAPLIVADTLQSISGHACKVSAVVTSQFTPPPTAPSTASRQDVEALASELGGIVKSVAKK